MSSEDGGSSGGDSAGAAPAVGLEHSTYRFQQRTPSSDHFASFMDFPDWMALFFGDANPTSGLVSGLALTPAANVETAAMLALERSQRF